MTDQHIKRTSYLWPACDEGRHAMHPSMSCDEADREITFWDDMAKRVFEASADLFDQDFFATPMADVPPALRGPRWVDRSEED